MTDMCMTLQPVFVFDLPIRYSGKRFTSSYRVSPLVTTCLKLYFQRHWPTLAANHTLCRHGIWTSPRSLVHIPYTDTRILGYECTVSQYSEYWIDIRLYFNLRTAFGLWCHLKKIRIIK
jgi:hypothetical protein